MNRKIIMVLVFVILFVFLIIYYFIGISSAGVKIW